MNDDLLSPVRLSSNAVLINATLPCEAQFERRTDQCIYLPGPAGSLMTGVRAYPWRPLVQWLLPVPALQRHNPGAAALRGRQVLLPGDQVCPGQEEPARERQEVRCVHLVGVPPLSLPSPMRELRH